MIAIEVLRATSPDNRALLERYSFLPSLAIDICNIHVQLPVTVAGVHHRDGEELGRQSGAGGVPRHRAATEAQEKVHQETLHTLYCGTPVRLGSVS